MDNQHNGRRGVEVSFKILFQELRIAMALAELVSHYESSTSSGS